MLRGSPVAQLSDDCFAFGGDLLTVDAALRMIATGVTCVDGVERMDLRAADGRILAEDVIAPVDLPPFDNAAVDGYAVRLADLEGSPELPVDGRLAAGAPVTHALEPGTARRIFTGAALPPGADTIFMQEDVRLDDDGRVRFLPVCGAARIPGRGVRTSRMAHARCGKASAYGRKISRWRRPWVCDGCRCGDLSGSDCSPPGMNSSSLGFRPGRASATIPIGFCWPLWLAARERRFWTSVFCRTFGTPSPAPSRRPRETATLS